MVTLGEVRSGDVWKKEGTATETPKKKERWTLTDRGWPKRKG